MDLLLIPPSTPRLTQMHPPVPTMSHPPTVVNYPPIILRRIMARGNNGRTLPSVIHKQLVLVCQNRQSRL